MKYYILFNKDDQELPLGPFVEEEHVKQVLKTDLRIIKEIIPSYGHGFKGDLTPVRYEEVEKDDALGKMAKSATMKMFEERSKAFKKRIIMEGRYENMSNVVDEWGKRIAGLAIFIIASVLLLYGSYFILAKVLPALITWIIVGSITLVAMYFPLAYIIGYLTTKYGEEEEGEGDDTSTERELVEDLQKGKNEAGARAVPERIRNELFHGADLREIFNMKACDYVFEKPSSNKKKLVFHLAMKASVPSYRPKLFKEGAFFCPSCGRAVPLKKRWVKGSINIVKCMKCSSKYREAGNSFEFFRYSRKTCDFLTFT